MSQRFTIRFGTSFKTAKVIIGSAAMEMDFTITMENLLPYLPHMMVSQIIASEASRKITKDISI